MQLLLSVFTVSFFEFIFNFKHSSSLYCCHTGGASLDLNAVDPKPFRWILDITWLNLVEISKLSTFSDVLTKVQICNLKQENNLPPYSALNMLIAAN
jgi:hypothetical protein